LLVQVSVQSLGLDRASNTPVVILQEDEGERVLPIWIGPNEAHAIASEMADMKYPRPLTHDLLASVLGGLGGALQKVVISRVEENTYFAEMIIRRNGEVISVDARPSDSIAVALRLHADIFAHEELLEQTTVDGPGEPVLGESPIPEGESDSGMAAEELNEYLRKLAPEDFGRFTP
jgi:bifunctional DNase/RNase